LVLPQLPQGLARAGQRKIGKTSDTVLVRWPIHAVSGEGVDKVTAELGAIRENVSPISRHFSVRKLAVVL
jgi:hypothetical protein